MLCAHSLDISASCTYISAIGEVWVRNYDGVAVFRVGTQEVEYVINDNVINPTLHWAKQVGVKVRHVNTLVNDMVL